MIKEAIDRIIELTVPSTYIDAEGAERFTNTNKLVGMPSGAHAPAECSSLASLCEFAKNSTEWVDDGKQDSVFFEVQGAASVSLFQIEKYDGQEKNESLCNCKAILPENFPFGHFQEVDKFIIRACDFFERDEAFKALIADVSAITDFQSSDVLDDGVTQEATTKSGIGRKDKTKISPFRTLRAYRTFRDIEQPQADYLLRIQKGDKAPLVALFEASGYGWKIAAVEAIAEFIKREIPTAMVLK
jgi:hypothetical protein